MSLGTAIGCTLKIGAAAAAAAAAGGGGGGGGGKISSGFLGSRK